MNKEARVKQVTDALLGFSPGMKVLVRYTNDTKLPATLIERLTGPVWIVQYSRKKYGRDVVHESQLEHAP
jgi:hypothetical protein